MTWVPVVVVVVVPTELPVSLSLGAWCVSLFCHMRSPATPTARWRCLSAIREVYPTKMCWNDSLVSMGGMRSSFWSSAMRKFS